MSCCVCTTCPAVLYCAACHLSLCTEGGCDAELHRAIKLKDHKRRRLSQNMKQITRQLNEEKQLYDHLAHNLRDISSDSSRSRSSSRRSSISSSSSKHGGRTPLRRLSFTAKHTAPLLAVPLVSTNSSSDKREGMCQLCWEAPAALRCDTCSLSLCSDNLCDSTLHQHKLTTHKRTAIQTQNQNQSKLSTAASPSSTTASTAPSSSSSSSVKSNPVSSLTSPVAPVSSTAKSAPSPPIIESAPATPPRAATTAQSNDFMPLCDICDEPIATLFCPECNMNVCADDDKNLHFGKKASHHRVPILSSSSSSAATAPSLAASNNDAAAAAAAPPAAVVSSATAAPQPSPAPSAIVTDDGKKPICDICDEPKATLFCPECDMNICADDDGPLHTGKKASHKRSAITDPLCSICEADPATLKCADCAAVFCKGCDADYHKPARMKAHVRTSLSGDAPVATPTTTESLPPTPAVSLCDACEEQAAVFQCAACGMLLCEDDDAALHTGAKTKHHVRVRRKGLDLPATVVAPTTTTTSQAASASSTTAAPAASLCSICDELPGTIHCQQCNEYFCAQDDKEFHRPASMSKHVRVAVGAASATAPPAAAAASPAAPQSTLTTKSSPMCDVCDEVMAIVNCAECGMNLCKDDDGSLHTGTKTKLHVRKPLVIVSNEPRTVPSTTSTVPLLCDICDTIPPMFHCAVCKLHLCGDDDLEVHNGAKTRGHIRTSLAHTHAEQSHPKPAFSIITSPPTAAPAASHPTPLPPQIIVTDAHPPMYMDSLALPTSPTSPTRSKQLCEICEDNAATIHCMDCSIYLCDSPCEQTLHAPAGMQNHRRKFITASSSPIPSPVPLPAPFVSPFDVELPPAGTVCSVCLTSPAVLYCPACKLSLCTFNQCDYHIHKVQAIALHHRFEIPNALVLQEEYAKQQRELHQQIRQQQLNAHLLAAQQQQQQQVLLQQQQQLQLEQEQQRKQMIIQQQLEQHAQQQRLEEEQHRREEEQRQQQLLEQQRQEAAQKALEEQRRALAEQHRAVEEQRHAFEEQQRQQRQMQEEQQRALAEQHRAMEEQQRQIQAEKQRRIDEEQKLTSLNQQQQPLISPAEPHKHTTNEAQSSPSATLQHLPTTTPNLTINPNSVSSDPSSAPQSVVPTPAEQQQLLGLIEDLRSRIFELETKQNDELRVTPPLSTSNKQTESQLHTPSSSLDFSISLDPDLSSPPPASQSSTQSSTHPTTSSHDVHQVTPSTAPSVHPTLSLDTSAPVEPLSPTLDISLPFSPSNLATLENITTLDSPKKVKRQSTMNLINQFKLKQEMSRRSTQEAEPVPEVEAVAVESEPPVLSQSEGDADPPSSIRFEADPVSSARSNATSAAATASESESERRSRSSSRRKLREKEGVKEEEKKKPKKDRSDRRDRDRSSRSHRRDESSLERSSHASSTHSLSQSRSRSRSRPRTPAQPSGSTHRSRPTSASHKSASHHRRQDDEDDNDEESDDLFDQLESMIQYQLDKRLPAEDDVVPPLEASHRSDGWTSAKDTERSDVDAHLLSQRSDVASDSLDNEHITDLSPHPRQTRSREHLPFIPRLNLPAQTSSAANTAKATQSSSPSRPPLPPPQQSAEPSQQSQFVHDDHANRPPFVAQSSYVPPPPVFMSAHAPAPPPTSFVAPSSFAAEEYEKTMRRPTDMPLATNPGDAIAPAFSLAPYTKYESLDEPSLVSELLGDWKEQMHHNVYHSDEGMFAHAHPHPPTHAQPQALPYSHAHFPHRPASHPSPFQYHAQPPFPPAHDPHAVHYSSSSVPASPPHSSHPPIENVPLFTLSPSAPSSRPPSPPAASTQHPKAKRSRSSMTRSRLLAASKLSDIATQVTIEHSDKNSSIPLEHDDILSPHFLRRDHSISSAAARGRPHSATAFRRAYNVVSHPSHNASPFISPSAFVDSINNKKLSQETRFHLMQQRERALHHMHTMSLYPNGTRSASSSQRQSPDMDVEYETLRRAGVSRGRSKKEKFMSYVFAPGSAASRQHPYASEHGTFHAPTHFMHHHVAHAQPPPPTAAATANSHARAHAYSSSSQFNHAASTSNMQQFNQQYDQQQPTQRHHGVTPSEKLTQQILRHDLDWRDANLHIVHQMQHIKKIAKFAEQQISHDTPYLH